VVTAFSAASIGVQTDADRRRHGKPPSCLSQWKGSEKVTIGWFVVWLVCDLVGDREPLRFDPLNWWAATLLLAFALDVNRPQVIGRRK
jgi:hypothetical protein